LDSFKKHRITIHFCPPKASHKANNVEIELHAQLDEDDLSSLNENKLAKIENNITWSLETPTLPKVANAQPKLDTAFRKTIIENSLSAQEFADFLKKT
jgi:hypothetical protein